MATRTMTPACPAPVTSNVDLLQNHPQLAEYASNSRDAHDGHHPHWPKCHDDNRKKSGGGGAAYYGSYDEVLLFCSPPRLPSNDADDDVSPPDSPSMPWRPGSSAYPPPSPVIFPASAMIAPALHAQNDSTTDDDDSTYSSRIRQSKKELQQLYDSLCEASYDLSLRDIVKPPFSIHGTLLAAAPYSQEAHAAPSEPLSSSNINSQAAVSPPRHCRRPYRTSQATVSPPRQVRSQSCCNLDKSIERRASSDQCKLAFSFSFPRSDYMALPLPDGLRKTPLRMQENALRTSSSLPRLAHLLSTPDDDKPPSPASSMAVCHNGHLPLSGSSSKRTSFKRSSISTAARRPLAPPLKLKDRNSRRKEQKQQLTMRAGGSSSRVHPSSQCSSCASYTIFFKSRCTVCGRLYCSNCAKDAMDLVSAGRRCKSSCNARLGSSRRFSKSVKSKCWPLCGNDIDVSKDPIVCKSVC